MLVANHADLVRCALLDRVRPVADRRGRERASRRFAGRDPLEQVSWQGRPVIQEIGRLDDIRPQDHTRGVVVDLFIGLGPPQAVARVIAGRRLLRQLVGKDRVIGGHGRAIRPAQFLVPAEGDNQLIDLRDHLGPGGCDDAGRIEEHIGLANLRVAVSQCRDALEHAGRGIAVVEAQDRRRE